MYIVRKFIQLLSTFAIIFYYLNEGLINDYVRWYDSEHDEIGLLDDMNRQKFIVWWLIRFLYMKKAVVNYYAIVIGISEANPLAESVHYSTPVHYVPIGTTKYVN